MTSALIGHTGLVGGNLRRQARFDDCFNSKNIESIIGREYELIVCAGARAEKWLANQDPATDRQGIERLMQCLSGVRARKVILISTVDVFSMPRLVDEASPVVTEGLGAYGRHRFELEQFVRGEFSSLVVRLPGLFGVGLKKNVIYDFLHDNRTDQIHHASRFQFYELSRLWQDIECSRQQGLELVHFATEPVSVAEIAEVGFGQIFKNETASPPASYDFRSRFAELLGGANGYLANREEVLRAIRAYVEQELGNALCR